jgi:hypothetical protein
LNISVYEYLSSEQGKEQYGTLGERGTIRLVVAKTSDLKGEYVGPIDASILKQFN